MSALSAAADLRLARAAVLAAVCVALAAGGHALAGGGTPGVGVALLGWAVVLLPTALAAGRERRSPLGIVALVTGAQVGLHALFSRFPSFPASSPASSPGSPGSSAPVGPAGTGRDGTTGAMELAARLLCNDHAANLTPGAAEEIVRAAGLDPTGAPGGAGHALGDHLAAGPGTIDAIGPLTGGSAMLLAHLVAAVATGLLLARGEAALWCLIRLSRTAARDAADRSLPALPVLGLLGWGRAVARALSGATAPPVPPARSRTAHGPAVPLRGPERVGGVGRRGPPRAGDAGRPPLVLAA
ncbi:hypothetical protein GCM10027160_03780 [Streptomyces calidiresistens]|uniref:Integral membrane protein n=1 Tax=Streptomyces calidiresistens TaxID=1485586 RepID=A0A7W3XYL3_9ACTN|nr:hypothetical protein [Streptomyces calidiresistens]MBB0231936.1 hypothetical protein [Streptomyces calidiresistens]